MTSQRSAPNVAPAPIAPAVGRHSDAIGRPRNVAHASPIATSANDSVHSRRRNRTRLITLTSLAIVPYERRAGSGMRELLDMWSNTRMVVLTAMCASLYAAVLIPFMVV